jgi:hypothetical protein
MHPLRIAAIAPVIALLFLGGCFGGDSGGPGRQNVYKVTGKITMNGAPVANAIVTFSPRDKQPVAVGRTNDNGEYTLTTYDGGDGAAAGPYVVMVVKESAVAAPAEMAHGVDAPGGPPAHAAAGGGTAGAPDASSMLPKKYAGQTSPLQATVTADAENNFPFDLAP